MCDQDEYNREALQRAHHRLKQSQQLVLLTSQISNNLPLPANSAHVVRTIEHCPALTELAALTHNSSADKLEEQLPFDNTQASTQSFISPSDSTVSSTLQDCCTQTEPTASLPEVNIDQDYQSINRMLFDAEAQYKEKNEVSHQHQRLSLITCIINCLTFVSSNHWLLM